MSEKRFTIVGEEYVGYMQGNAYIISNGECKFSLWERKEDAQKVCDKLNELYEENEQLRQMIKENVFQQYREGSLADLEFKAIAYDDIVKLEMSNELEPKVIVYCRQGKKENVKSFCQMFIPFGVYYEIKESIKNEL